MKSRLQHSILKALIVLALVLSASFIFSQVGSAAPLSPILLLKEVEKKYQAASGIQMDVIKKLKIQLLEKEKKSEGLIKIKSGGFFKWEVTKPDHSMTLLTPAAVWVVDYPIDIKDKVMVLKSRKPKKNQSPAVVAFLMGQGSLTKNFKVKPVKGDLEFQELILKAKSIEEPVQEMTVYLDKKAKLITRLNFKDAMGNETELQFINTDFEKTFTDSEFSFIPPKDADVSIID